MERNQPIDALRFLCALLVILLHICASYVVNGIQKQDFDFWVANVLNSFARIAVPIFILISGKFLLSRPESPKVFYKKRLNKLAIPTLFWSLVYSVYTLLSYKLFKNDWNFDQVFQNLLHGVPHYHLWYLFMLMGLYLTTPLIHTILAPLRLKVQTLIGFALMFFGVLMDIWDRYHNNTQIFLLWFLPFIGYFILGHTLPQHRFGSKALLLVIFIFSTAITAVLTGVTAAWLHGELYFYSYLSPGVILAAVSIYLVFHLINVRSNIYSELAKYTLGIYIIHAAFLDVFKYYFFSGRISDNIFVEIATLFMLVLLPTILCTYLIRKVPVIKKTV